MVLTGQQTNYFLNNVLAGIINPTLAAPLLPAAAKSGLGTAYFTPTLTTTFADLVEATFVGYAQSATIVWGAPVNNVDTTPVSLSPAALFRCTASTTPNTVQNVFTTDGVASPGTGILMCATFQPGILIANVGDGFTVVTSLSLTGGDSAYTIIQ